MRRVGSGYDPVSVRLAGAAGAETFDPPLANEITQIFIDALRVTLLGAEQLRGNFL